MASLPIGSSINHHKEVNMLDKRRLYTLFILLMIGISSCTPSPTPTAPPEATTIPPTVTSTSSTDMQPTRILVPEVATATEEAPPPVLPEPVIDYDRAIPHVEAGADIEIIEITMSDTVQGWGIAQANDGSDHILRTYDGGVSWWDITPPESAPSDDSYLKAAAFFLDADNAWVSFSPYEIIWRTSDAGITWLPARTALATKLGADLYFADRTNGWIMKYLDAGMSHVYTGLSRTTSGGAYWETVFDPYSSVELQSCSKTGLVFVDAEVGWVTRDCGGVQPGAFVDVTNDGGNTWEEISLPPPQDNPNKFTDEYCAMYSPNLLSRNTGVLVVRCKRYDDGDSVLTNYIFSTSDGGQTWNRHDYPGGDLVFINDTAYALSREIHRSSDAGKTWTHVKDVNWDGQFSFVNENLAWAVAKSGEEIALVKTTDGCSSFSEIPPEVIEPPSEYAMVSQTLGGSFEDLTGQIAFISYRDTTDPYNSDIFILDLEDESLTKITNSSGTILNFSWSPDGDRLVFDSDMDGDNEIYTIRVDGTLLTQLTTNDIQDGDPSWSPDGTQIAYTVNDPDCQAIYIMNVDGSNAHRLTAGFTPAWSPDGLRIAFSRIHDGIYTIEPSGTNLTQLTDSSEHGWDAFPVWSPDGTKIIFGSNRHAPGDFATDSVYIMNADGSGIGRLSQTWGSPPYAWSPDGLWIIYTEGFGNGSELLVMDSYGLDSMPLADDNIGFHPLWRP
jgi:photosystem II stability/assembly factor-like uncharacterized protein